MVRTGMDYGLVSPPGAVGHWLSGYFRPGLEALRVRNCEEKTFLETVCVTGKKLLVSKKYCYKSKSFNSFNQNFPGIKP